MHTLCTGNYKLSKLMHSVIHDKEKRLKSLRVRWPSVYFEQTVLIVTANFRYLILVTHGRRRHSDGRKGWQIAKPGWENIPTITLNFKSSKVLQNISEI